MAGKDLPIIVAGGGIGGFAAALALTQQGISGAGARARRRFPRARRRHPARAERVPHVRVLGVARQMSHWAVFPDNLIMRDALDGSEVTRIPAGEPLRRHFGYPYAVIHRADLHKVLIDAVKRSPLATLTTSCKVASYEDRGDRVVVQTEGRQDHRGRRADRRRRPVVGGAQPAGRRRQAARLRPHRLPRRDSAGRRCRSICARTTWCCGRGRRRTWCTIRCIAARSTTWWSCSTAAATRRAGTPTAIRRELRERFAGQHPKVREFLAMANEWKMWVLCDREPDQPLDPGPRDPARRRGAPDAAIPGAGRLHGDRGRGGAGAQPRRGERRLQRRLPRLSARALPAHHARAADRAHVRRHLSRHRRRARPAPAMLAGRTPEQAYNGVAWLYDGIPC